MRLAFVVNFRLKAITSAKMHCYWMILGVLVFGRAGCIDVDSFWKYTTNSTGNSSGKCNLHLHLFFKALRNGELWAIQSEYVYRKYTLIQ